MYDILKSHILSLNNVGTNLGDIEAIKALVLQSDLNSSQKTELLGEIREISFGMGIDLDFQDEDFEQYSDSESYEQATSETVVNIENIEGEGNIHVEIENDEKTEGSKSKNNEIGSLFDEGSKNLLLDYKRYH